MRDSKRDTDVLNSLLDSVGEGEGGMIWENGIETCKLLYVKRITSPGSMHDTGCSGWCTGMTQRDGMGREMGVGFRMYTLVQPCTHVHPWRIQVNVWQNQYNVIK